MRSRAFAIFAISTFFWILAVSSNASAGFLVGSTLAISVDDSPLGTNFTQNVTLAPGTTPLDQGELSLTQTLVPAGPNSQWLVLDFEATNGALLAGNLGGYWEIQQTAQLASPGNWTGFFIFWTVNGVATNPIYPFGGLTQIGSNPLNASSPAYGAFFFDPNVSTSIRSFVDVSPYSYISNGGMDPNAVNGFTMEMQATNAVPEPAALCLAGLGALMVGSRIGFARLWRVIRRA